MKTTTFAWFLCLVSISSSFGQRESVNTTHSTTGASATNPSSTNDGSLTPSKNSGKKPTTETTESPSTKLPSGTITTTIKHKFSTKAKPKTVPKSPTKHHVSTGKRAGTRPTHETTTIVPSKTSNSSSTSTAKPETLCEARNDSCSTCIDGNDCVYCSSDHSCFKKKGKLIPTRCKGNHWYWKQCKIPGNILIIVIPTVGGVFLIMLGCCIYCCCCRRCRRNKAAREETRQHQRRLDRQERNAERRQNRQARHEAIRVRYGLLKNHGDDEEFDGVV